MNLYSDLIMNLYPDKQELSNEIKNIREIITNYAFDLLYTNQFWCSCWPIIHLVNMNGCSILSSWWEANANSIPLLLKNDNLKIDLQNISCYRYKLENGCYGDLLNVSCWVRSKNPKLKDWIATYGKTNTAKFFIPDQFIDFTENDWPKTYKEFKELVNLTIL